MGAQWKGSAAQQAFEKKYECDACLTCLNAGTNAFHTALFKGLTAAPEGWHMQPTSRVAIESVSAAALALCQAVFPGDDGAAVCTRKFADFFLLDSKWTYRQQLLTAVLQEAASREGGRPNGVQQNWHRKTLAASAFTGAGAAVLTAGRVCNEFALCPSLTRSGAQMCAQKNAGALKAAATAKATVDAAHAAATNAATAAKANEKARAAGEAASQRWAAEQKEDAEMQRKNEEKACLKGGGEAEMCRRVAKQAFDDRVKSIDSIAAGH
jgi:hypothetical protein